MIERNLGLLLLTAGQFITDYQLHVAAALFISYTLKLDGSLAATSFIIYSIQNSLIE